ncbi:MAG: SpoVG family protein [Phycisphaerae bacterium]|jgi:stage V sporulation protein G
MEVSKVQVKLAEKNDERLKAFCSVVLCGEFVVRDIKIIEGPSGLFVAMPSKQLTEHCSCGAKNGLKARYCSFCGRLLDSDGRRGVGDNSRIYTDIAHPISAECRDTIQEAILNAYQQELSNHNDKCVPAL